MTPELLSLTCYLASSRAEFTLVEMNQYLSRKYEEKELYESLKTHFYDLTSFATHTIIAQSSQTARFLRTMRSSMNLKIC